MDYADLDGDAVQPPWWSPVRAGSRRRQPLTRDTIVQAAVRVLDREGVDAMTVRRIGDELNTGSATLYWHVGSKEELAELVYDHVIGEVAPPEPDPARWQEQLKDLGRQVFRVMRSHNDVVRLSVGRVPVGPNALRVAEWILDLLRRAGVPDQAAARFGDWFGRYIDASVLDELPSGGPPPDQLEQYFADLPPERFPNLVALVPTMFGGDAESRFEFGMDLLVRGLADYVDSQA